MGTEPETSPAESDSQDLPADRIVDGQIFVATAAQPYVRKDGAHTRLVDWQSTCPRCGDPFTFQLGERVTRFPLRWGCEKHHREVAASAVERHPELAPPPRKPKVRTPVQRDAEQERRRLRQAARVAAVFDRHPEFAASFPDGNLPDWAIDASEGHHDPARSSAHVLPDRPNTSMPEYDEYDFADGDWE